MTPYERVKAVYQGRVPDKVPLLLDLSHWYYRNYQVFFDLNGFSGVEKPLIELHQQVGAVAYWHMENFYEIFHADGRITERAWTDDSGVYRHEIISPWGNLCEERVFEPVSYSYNIRKRLLNSVDDFDIIIALMSSYRCRPRFARFESWQEALGDLGFIYCHLPYSGLGYLISRNLGVEGTCFAVMDHPRKVQELVDAVNESNLRILDTLLDGPYEVMLLCDNLDGNLQSPPLFRQYSQPFYREVARRLHLRGKYLAVHVDGEMNGCLEVLRECGVDCIDAATPAPMFKLTPAQARAQAGNMILSGGIPATVFGATGTDAEFEASVIQWLDTRHTSPRLILAAGDQVPPDAPRSRIEWLSKLVDRHGRY